MASGILNISGYDEQFIMHGVHMIFNGEKGRKWKVDERRVSRLVFIGRNLNAAELDQHFTNCRASLKEIKLKPQIIESN